ncbi:hypothetical protein SUDANB145_07160 (plasmid) [Streptomyces sp. enrichment culture]|uniref:hypothetical protein n=1 Tax=Streptomyces sp. enrichment culture TaxID=1795815 RepID=UPI003F57A025
MTNPTPDPTAASITAWEPCSSVWLAAMPAGACGWAPRQPGGDGVSHLHPAVPTPVDRAALRQRAVDALMRLGHPQWDADEGADAVLDAVLPAPADRTVLRERIAAALYERERPPGAAPWADVLAADREVFEAMADAVLPLVLPAPADRAAALTDAERTMLTYALNEAQEHIWSRDGFTDEDQAALDSLRRMAAEAQPATPDTEAPLWARPDTEEEKLAKCRRMAKALSAPPEPPAEWASTTEWPGRHKRPGDRRIHATAPFIVGSVQRIWTACRERVGPGGTSLPHMAVDCRACKQATEPAGSAAAPVHLGGRANAEDCPGCKAERRNLPYPFLCPAEPGSAAAPAKEA